jgi:hypothetical protein
LSAKIYSTVIIFAGEEAKMTDNEIIKALEYCQQQGITSECERCKVKRGCRATLIENALDLIERQKAEIEKLQVSTMVCEQRDLIIRNSKLITLNWGNPIIVAIKSEAVREFAERLKAEIKSDLYGDDVIPRGTIDWLVKEMASQTFWESDAYVGTEQIDILVKEMMDQF